MITTALSLMGGPPAISDAGIMPPLLGAAGLFTMAPALTAQPLQHYGQGQEIKSFDAFKRRMRPGDILISGDKKILPIPTGVNLVTGNPNGQHVSVVHNARKNWDIDSHPYYGFNSTSGNIHKDHNLQILRFNDAATKNNVLRGMRRMERAVNIFEEEVKKMLINKGWPSAAATIQAQSATSALYDTPAGIKAGLKDLFLPNLSSAASIKNLNNENFSGTRNFMQNAKSYAHAMADLIDTDPSGNKLSIADFRKVLPKYSGGVCSSMPAILGKADITPGTAARDILTSDYLKSDALTPIARYMGGKPEGFLNNAYFAMMARAPKTLRALPGLGLLGTGLGLAFANRNRRLETDILNNNNLKNTAALTALLDNIRNAKS